MCEECAELTRRNFLKGVVIGGTALGLRSEEHTSELQSLS
jgi:hypothetical protein